MNENEWDKLLKIHTTGTDNTDADQYRYPYEPTPYSVLERLGNSGWIRKENTLLDYGCGNPIMKNHGRCSCIFIIRRTNIWHIL